jgi:hypothetical protein
VDLRIAEPRRTPNRLPDHLLLWGVAFGTLMLFATSRDFYRGKAEIGDAIPFTVAFLVTGYFLFGLSWIWGIADRTRVAGLVLPGFMAVVMAYFVLGCRAGFIQPPATAIAVLAQVVSLIVVGARGSV